MLKTSLRQALDKVQEEPDSWHIMAKNFKRDQTEHFWISDSMMKELRHAAIHGLEIKVVE